MAQPPDRLSRDRGHPMAYQYGPVVAGVDGSAHSIGALRWAADEAHRLNRMLLVVHAQAEDDVHRAEDVAAQAADEARRWRVGVASTDRTERGTPTAVLRRQGRAPRRTDHGRDPRPCAQGAPRHRRRRHGAARGTGAARPRRGRRSRRRQPRRRWHDQPVARFGQPAGRHPRHCARRRRARPVERDGRPGRRRRRRLGGHRPGPHSGVRRGRRPWASPGCCSAPSAST
jgi:hypothetical protein